MGFVTDEHDWAIDWHARLALKLEAERNAHKTLNEKVIKRVEEMKNDNTR